MKTFLHNLTYTTEFHTGPEPCTLHTEAEDTSAVRSPCDPDITRSGLRKESRYDITRSGLQKESRYGFLAELLAPAHAPGYTFFLHMALDVGSRLGVFEGAFSVGSLCYFTNWRASIMSVLVLLEINVKPEKADGLSKFLRDELHHTRGFAGCNGITFHRNQDDPNTVVAVEDWDSRQHYEKYLAWRTERGDLEKLGGWLSGEPSIPHFDNMGV